MKLLCACGNVIVDQTDDLPDKGWVTRDKHEERTVAAARSITAFFRACADGDRSRWLSERFGRTYPQELPDEAVVTDLLGLETDGVRSPLYQCVECGRLWLQNHHQPGWLSFWPEDGVFDVLDVGPDDTAAG